MRPFQNKKSNRKSKKPKQQMVSNFLKTIKNNKEKRSGVKNFNQFCSENNKI